MKNNKSMMIKKKLGVLAAAVAAVSSAQAAFDTNAVLFAYDINNENNKGADTYFVDLGVTADALTNVASVNITDSGLGTWLSTRAGAQWTVIGTVNEQTLVGGPPAVGQSFLNNGIVSSSSTGTAVDSTGSTMQQGQATLNNWLSLVEANSTGSSFVASRDDDWSANSSINNAGFNNSLIDLGQYSTLYYNQADPSDGAKTSDFTISSQIGTAGTSAQLAALLTSDGTFQITAVPVPAAAWLFGSALAGLGYVRRKK